MNNITEYINTDKEDRTKHIRLNTECIPSVNEEGHFKSPQYSIIEALEKVSDYLGLDTKELQLVSGHVRPFHACCNNHSAPLGYVCTNPEHIFVGTEEEAKYYQPIWKKKKGGQVSWARMTPAEREARKKHVAQKVSYMYHNTEKGKRLKEEQSVRSTSTMKRQLKEGRHISQKINTCEHCGKQMQGRIFFRWHGDNCRLKGKPQNNGDK